MLMVDFIDDGTLVCCVVAGGTAVAAAASIQHG